MNFNTTTDTELRSLLAQHQAVNDVKAQEWIVGILDELRFRQRHPEYAVA